jgi:hypothetical protein
VVGVVPRAAVHLPGVGVVGLEQLVAELPHAGREEFVIARIDIVRAVAPTMSIVTEA